MKAKNLRTGNLVQDENETIQYVYCIWQKGVGLSKDENGGDDTDYEEDEIFGVPITELWLEKLGFISDLIDDYKSLPIGNDTFLSSGGDAVWVDKVIGEKTHCVGLGGAKYIHELQNLFFALTGTELNIRL